MSRLLIFKQRQQLCCFALFRGSHLGFCSGHKKICIGAEIPAVDGQKMKFSLLAPSLSCSLCRTGVLLYSRNSQFLPMLCLPSSCSSHSETPLCEVGGKSWRRGVVWLNTCFVYCSLQEGKCSYLLQGTTPVIAVYLCLCALQASAPKCCYAVW